MMKLIFYFVVLFFLCFVNIKAQEAHPEKLWDKAFGGSGDDWLYSIAPSPDGGYLLGGYSLSGFVVGDKSEASRGVRDYWVVKIDAAGNKLWDKTFGGSGDDWLYSIVPSPDGGYLLGGYSESGISGDKSEASRGFDDYWVVKIDAAGNKLWDKTFGGTGDDELYSIAPSADGGYLLGGYSSSGLGADKSEASRGSFDYWLVKIDACWQ